MRPPVPIKFPKVVPPQGDEIDGKFIPGGTAIGWNLIPMMRSTRHWGQDAEVFRPERFTEAGEDTRLSMERLVELVFGHGRFSCAGKPLAFMELNKVYFEVSALGLTSARGLRGAKHVLVSFSDTLTSRLSTRRSRGTPGFGVFGWMTTFSYRSPRLL
jgi:hypothetical protein